MTAIIATSKRSDTVVALKMVTTLGLATSDGPVSNHSITLAYLPDHSVELFPQCGTTTFTVFDNLPLELRNMIWKWSCLRPRRVKLRKMIHAHGDRGETGSLWVSPCHPQVTLLINRESREQALKHLKPLINSELINKRPFCHQYQLGYINPEIDTLIIPVMWIFSGRLVLSFLDKPLLGLLRSLEIHSSPWGEPEMNMFQTELAWSGQTCFGEEQTYWTLFTALEYLLINMCRPPAFEEPRSLLSQEELENCTQFVVGRFEHRKATSPECNIPKVEVRQKIYN